MACQLVIILFSVLIWAAALHPPSYIIPCSRSDPKLNECAEKHGRLAIPYIVKGDKQFHIPNMTPLIIPRIDIESGPGLKMQFTDAKISGLENMQIKRINVDVKNMKSTAVLYCSRIEMNCDYSIEGKILVVPITGNGPARFSFLDGNYTFSFDWSVSKKKDGKDYANVTSYKMEISSGRNQYYLENLFNGNKLLGDQVNKFMNENWKEIHEELSPAVVDVVGALCLSIAKSIYERIPYDELLLP